MIPQDKVAEIIETARVEEVIEDHVTLKRRGANLLGNCPFHNEKTPSFTVSPAKGIYKCFGCGKAGNVVNFLMDHEQLSYPEALRSLAKRYNIEIEEEELTVDQRQELNAKESLYIVSQFAADFFQEQLTQTQKGRAIGLSYFKERGFSEETIKKFQLGYSPDEWTALTDAAIEKGYQLDFLEKTGLTIVKEEKKFDRFKGRVMFPIQNISGRVLGFGGRILTSDKKAAKYLNSPESDIYHKSKVLYGIFHAKKSIVAKDTCYLVEGYTDVISLHQSGVENVVASSGTSLTIEQIRLIKRYTPNITILFDGDAAGLKASFRGIDMILEAGLNVKVVLFPDGEDPDSYARSHTQAEILSFLDSESKDFIKFKTDVLLKEAGKDPIKKAGLIKDIVESIALIPDPIIRSVYIQECSSMMGMEEEMLLTELNKSRKQKISKKLAAPNESTPQINVPEYLPQEGGKSTTKKINYQEQDIIRLMIQYGLNEIELEVDKDEKGNPIKEPFKLVEVILSDLMQDDIAFDDPTFALIYKEFTDAYEKEILLEEKHFIHHIDDTIRQVSIDLISQPYELSAQWEEKHQILTQRETDDLFKTIQSGLNYFKFKKLNNLKNEKRKLLTDATESEQYTDILLDIIKIDTSRKNLAKILGIVISD
ncbi:DNA primase [Acidiluteibacter ferrifornacis]|uniref:DNA primase n=1 Tax=Acidiluteibacter ferrifornacis TaxID=2692424 RepID=A0A6N9NFP2_9FLAO|nr:DNA primase [Acidiluteibacter ferrifornacis]MBR9830574.1 DNA primase [bacterium]NBG64592.1 DNA primase [Acidiluteibacter ferrifornacis]